MSYWKKFDLTMQIILAMVTGLVIAVFFGPYVYLLEPIGKAFVMLLQMPVLLFMFASIIVGIAQMKSHDGRLLFYYSLIFLACSWLITKLSIFIIPLAFPPIHSQTKYASPNSAVGSINLVDAFIPENPFKSFADGTVPAIVIFAIFFAAALLGVKKRDYLIQSMSVTQEASIKIVEWVSKLSFFGASALSASFFVSMTNLNISEIRYYYYSFIFGTLFVSVILIPLLVTVVIPVQIRQLLKLLMPALLLALVTASVLITLPLLLKALQKHMKECGYDEQKFIGFTSTLIPLTFNFPISSKLFNLLFIYFAGWYYQDNMIASEVVELSTLGLLTTFGSAPEGIGYLLDHLSLPIDAVNLFIPTMIITSKFAAVAHVSSLASLCFFTVTSWEKRLSFKLNTLAWSIFIALLGYGSWFFLMNNLAKPINETEHQYMRQQISEPAQYEIISDTSLIKPRNADSRLAQIHQTKSIIVGYRANLVPFSYYNKYQELVGIDIELAHHLAKSLDVKLILLAYEISDLDRLLSNRIIDLALSGLSINDLLNHQINASKPYLLSEAVLVTQDHERHLYDSLAKISGDKDISIAGLSQSEHLKIAPKIFKNPIISIKSPDELLELKEKTLLLWSNPQALTWTLIHPKFSLIHLRDTLKPDQLAFGLSHDSSDFNDYLSDWVELNLSNQTFQDAYKKWVLINP